MEANTTPILAEGIIPAKQSGLSNPSFYEPGHWRRKNVWMTHDFDYIINTQMGYDRGFVIMEVDVSDLEIRRRDDPMYFNNKGEDAEFLYEGVVPPERIKSVKLYKEICE